MDFTIKDFHFEYRDHWPKVGKAKDLYCHNEITIKSILDQMTIEEKIGQMIQPELFQITPDELELYKFGSALNGAGLFPGDDARAPQEKWVKMVDDFWMASQRAYKERPFNIPFMWATDAVHGHNNLFGATIFPHNIGLGCANDPYLVHRIGIATAKEVATTAIDWTFAPNVAAPRDYRWGRHFEGYSESPAVIASYADAMVRGLQGDFVGYDPDDSVIACAKHWIGDGATHLGIDRGDARCSEEMLLNIHAAGYIAAIAAGVNTIMVSFSGWDAAENYDHSPQLPGSYNNKLAGSHYLISDVLKTQLGFDGLVITDWDAHADVSRCDFGEAAYVINAGVDILMVSPRHGWMGLLGSLKNHIESGHIPMARVDDAVTRILRVKMRAGLWEKPRPVERPKVKNKSVIGCYEHRALAEEAIKKSAVLLKNNSATLPIRQDAKILVVGSAADSIQKICGGWTLSWQGTEITQDDIPHSSTIGEAIAEIVGAKNCTVDADLSYADPVAFDMVIAAIGEDAYAEMRGNIRPWRSLSYAKLKTSYSRDLAILQKIRSQLSDANVRTRVATLFFGGRPLYVSEEINLSDAFVAAWLPGPYSKALAALLFEAKNGELQYDFSGKLSFSWPKDSASFQLNHRPAALAAQNLAPFDDPMDAQTRALFPFGYGLSYASPASDMGPVPVEEVDHSEIIPAAKVGLDIFEDGMSDFDWMICGHNIWAGQRLNFQSGINLLIVEIQPNIAEARILDLNFKGFAALVYARFPDAMPRDFRPYIAASAFFEIDTDILSPPEGPLYLALHDDYPGQPGFDIAPMLCDHGPGAAILQIPMHEISATGMELNNIDTAFMLYSESKAHLSIRSIKIKLPR